MTNHQKVLEELGSVGYEMAWKKVCPTQAKTPQTRLRVHYQGVDAQKVPNAKAQMASLDACWSKLIAMPFMKVELDAFLVDPSCKYYQKELASLKPSGSSDDKPAKKAKKDDEQWRKDLASKCYNAQATWGFKLHLFLGPVYKGPVL